MLVSGCPVSEVSGCPGVRVSVSEVSGCPGVRLSGCPGVRVSGCLVPGLCGRARRLRRSRTQY